MVDDDGYEKTGSYERKEKTYAEHDLPSKALVQETADYSFRHFEVLTRISALI